MKEVNRIMGKNDYHIWQISTEDIDTIVRVSKTKVLLYQMLRNISENTFRSIMFR